jgi:replicative DNA helicase
VKNLVPSNIEAEQATLGSILIDPSAMVRVNLKPDDFYDPKNAWVYQAMVSLTSRRAGISIITVNDELERSLQLDEVGGPAYVMDLLNAVPTAMHAEHYAGIVKRTSIKRQMIRSAGRITQMAYDDDLEAGEAVSQSLGLLTEISRETTGSHTRTFNEILEQVYEDAYKNARIRAEGGLVAIPWPLSKLNEMSGGGLWPSKGQIAIVGAVPKAGKTTFAIVSALHAANLGFKGLILSLEMQGEEIVERSMSSTGYSTTEIRIGEIMDWDAFEDARPSLEHPNLWIDDSPTLTIQELETIVRRVDVESGGLDFIAIDYAQLVTVGGKVENRTQELSRISRGIKALAKDLNIAVILIAQINKEYTKRSSPRPKASDIEGSSQFQKEANIIIMIYREEEPASEADEASATIIVAANRSGRSGEFICGFDGAKSLFTDKIRTLGVTEKQQYKDRLMLQCQASPLAWEDWRAHIEPEAAATRIRQWYASAGEPMRTNVQPLVASIKGEAIHLPSLEKLEHANIPHTACRDLVGIARRKHILYQVRTELMPALTDKRFAVLYGPSGRGKSHMARIIQTQVIQTFGLPATWVNWRRFMRDIKDTYDGPGTEAEVWRASRAPVLILDDMDKMINQWHVQYLYDVLDEAMNLSGTPRSVIMVMNNTPEAYARIVSQFGLDGDAMAHRAFLRKRPVFINFEKVPNWTPPAAESPLF